MTANQTSFPTFPDGDVLIVLSDEAEDTLQLHVATLTKGSEFFKTSLEKVDWSHNRTIIPDATENAPSTCVKLLELEFDGSDAFPIFVRRTTSSPLEELKQRRERHDAELAACEENCELTTRKHASHTVIAAYKIAFALIPYILLPKLGEKMNNLIFGHAWCGYNLFAENPFGMLRVACELRSKTIYQEAMKHAVGLHDFVTRSAEVLDKSRCLSKMYFADAGDQALRELFLHHVREFRKTVSNLERTLLRLNVDSTADPWYGEASTARNIATTIWQDWVIKNIIGNDDDGHGGILSIINRSTNADSMVTTWGNRDWQEQLGVRSIAYEDGQYHPIAHMIHQSFQNVYNQAQAAVDKVFDPESAAKGKAQKDAEDDGDGSVDYIANMTSGADYKYPRDDAVPLPTFLPVRPAKTA